MKIETQIEGTQRDLINSLARIIAAGQGYAVYQDTDLTTSRNPRLKNFVRVAEQVYEAFVGDSPNYSDEDDDESAAPISRLRKYMVFSGCRDGLRVVEDLPHATVAAMSERESRHYWATTMFMSDETEAKCVWAISSEKAIEAY